MYKSIMQACNKSRDNIIALEHVHESTSLTIIHRRKLGKHNYCVSVKVVLDAKVLILIPNPDDDARLFKGQTF
ncbi:hypothetical protein PanWU01x14_205700 [Parasponia andersonii]|uniref:Uncharacterized protein n=1 Tax=Parasponia andersonii TaxID=3476 RepID=A0A2P5BVS5_PARAD|nr:hypothetical protein PanWU01x14_205700 [Parasponia andersonii]